MKLMLYIATATLVTGLRLTPSTHSHPSLLAAQQEVALVTRYVDGSLSYSDLEKAADAKSATMDWKTAAQSIKSELPMSLMVMMEEGEKQTPGRFEEASLDKARVILNGMLETAQEQYDLKYMECRAFDERNRAEFGQITKDLSRLGSAVAGDNSKILGSKADISAASMMIDGQMVAMKEAQEACLETKLANEEQLKVMKDDLAVSEFIIGMTECKTGGKGFLQTATIAACEHEDGSTYLTFDESALAAQVEKLQSQQAKDALALRLRAAHPDLSPEEFQKYEDAIFAHRAELLSIAQVKISEGKPKGAPAEAVTTAAPAVDLSGAEAPAVVAPKTAPTAEEAAGKCVLGNPDCGLLTDNMALMWGDIKDSVDELTSIMSANQLACKATTDGHNKEIETYQGALSLKNVELVEATGALGSNTEEQGQRMQQKVLVEEEYAEVHGECVAVLHEILFTQMCGTKTVRAEISKYSKRYGPTDIIDCTVADWVPQECTVECVADTCVPREPREASKGDAGDAGETCEGGEQDMTRGIVQKASLGAACPALLLVKGCNNVKCPIDCEQSVWSAFGKCSKECGGGVQQRSRNVEVRAMYGGEACRASSETQQCNVQSCDVDCVLAEWTAWGPCSRACGTGFQERAKLVMVPEAGKGMCLAEDVPDRYEAMDCNIQACPADPTCIAKQDVVIAVDVSGSLKQSGYDAMRALVDEMVTLYKLGADNAQIGVLEYSKQARIVSPLTSDIDQLKTNLFGLLFQQGVTDMAQGFSLAKTILMEGRADAQSVVILLTDGKPSFQFSTRVAAQELRDMGVRVVVVPVAPLGGDMSFMEDLCSDPPSDNVIKIEGIPLLAASIPLSARKLLTGTCAALEAPEAPAVAAKGGKGAAVLHILDAPDDGDVFHKHHLRTTYHRPHH